MLNRRAGPVPSAAPPPAAAGVIGRFVAWARRADAFERADGASALARAYLHAELADPARRECGLLLIALSDDPSVGVRRALAEAFASSRRAPRPLVVALIGDVSAVAAPLIARSPLLTDAELVDAAATGDSVAQCAVARRNRLGAGPAGALAEIGSREAALALIDNPTAALTGGALRRMLERFADDAEIRRALALRTGLPADLRAEIVIATEGALKETAGRLVRKRAARDAALAAIAADCPEAERAALVRTLRALGALTTALLLRALCGGDRALFAAALAELADIAPARAAGFAADPRGGGFAAAALKAGLPRHAVTPFRAALEAIAAHGAGARDGLRADLVAAVIAACEREGDPALAPFLALLWRFAAEAARSEARAALARRALPPNLDFAPANDDRGVTDVAPAILAAPDGEASGEAAPLVELPADLVLALDAA